jgi:methionine-rich copper-binding protein CopC
MKQFVLSSLALLALVSALAADAHTTVESAKPPSGAVLERSPPTIELKFKHAVQMTSIVVLEADKSERKLAFTPTASTAVVTIDNPALHTGHNEIRWKALSKDGHVIKGTLTYDIKPASASQ